MQVVFMHLKGGLSMKTFEPLLADDIWQMEDETEVLVSTLTLCTAIGRLTGIHANPTKEDRKLSNELSNLLSTTEHKNVRMSCKDIRRLLTKDDTNIYSFTTI